jgi:hypothetical protein
LIKVKLKLRDIDIHEVGGVFIEIMTVAFYGASIFPAILFPIYTEKNIWHPMKTCKTHNGGR